MPGALSFIPLALAASVPAFAATAVFWGATAAIQIGIGLGTPVKGTVITRKSK